MHKNYFITGATSGMGLEVTRQLLERGACVYGLGRNLEQIAELQQKYPKNLVVRSCDLALAGSDSDSNLSESQLETLVQDASKFFGPIDCFFLNAGVAAGNELTSWREVKLTIDTNISSTTRLLVLALAHLQNRRGTVAINTSVSCLLGLRQAPVYSASKAYLSNLCSAVRAKLRKEKQTIQIVEIRPGFVDTKMAGAQFWLVPLKEAGRQIIEAMDKGQSTAYISPRWSLIGFLIQVLPRWILERV